MNVTLTRRKLGRSVGGTTVGVGALLLALGLFASPAAAGGNPTFEGILDAAPPGGFTASPAAYNISHGPAMVDFDVVTTNLTTQTQSVALTFSVHHILTYKDINVADGQPGQPGLTFTGPQGTTQALMPGSTTSTETWGAAQKKTLLHEFVMNSCGYFQIDIWAPVRHPQPGQEHRATLASGFVRVLGCTGQGSGSPTPSPSGTTKATSTASSTASTPSGQVLAATTPGTGAGGGDGSIPAGALLITLGVIIVALTKGLAIAGSRRPPVDI
jgi:hypothetical protein